MARELAAKRSSGRFWAIVWELRIIIVFVMLFVALSLSHDAFFAKSNLINVLLQVSVNGLLSIGMTFIILTGGIDFSVGSVLAFGGVVAASFSSVPFRNVPAISPYLAICIGLAAGISLGALNGLVISWVKVPPFVMTLGMLSIARRFSFIYSNGMPVANLDKRFLAISQDWFILPIPVLVFLAVLAAAWVVLYRTQFGRSVYAVGGNARSARISGINVNFVIFMVYVISGFLPAFGGIAVLAAAWAVLYRMKSGRSVYAVGGNARSARISGINAKFVIFIVYVISGFLSALGGILLAARTSAGLPRAGVSYELDAIAAVVIGGTSMTGGKGSLLGTFTGVLIIGLINNGLDLHSAPTYCQQAVKDVIIIGALMLDYFQSDTDR